MALPYAIAFFVTVIGATGVTHLRDFSNPYPPGALIVQSLGHNAEAITALQGAGIPTLTIMDASSVQPASFPSSLLWTAIYFVCVFAAFFFTLALSKRLLQ